MWYFWIAYFSQKEPGRRSVQAEILERRRHPQAFGTEGDLQEVFGVGSNIDNAKIYDVRFKPSLSALRAHALVRKKHVGPAFKSANVCLCGSLCRVERPVVSANDKPAPPMLLRVQLMLPGMTADPAQGGTVVASRPICVSFLLTGPPPTPVVLGDFARDGNFASAVGGAKLWEQIQQEANSARNFSVEL